VNTIKLDSFFLILLAAFGIGIVVSGGVDSITCHSTIPNFGFLRTFLLFSFFLLLRFVGWR